jgi:monofunctional biosynthetic peptidoglycan transglycosylase
VSKVGAFLKRLWNGSGEKKPWLRRIALVIFALLVPLPILYLLVFRFVPVPATPQMALYAVTFRGVNQSWRSIDSMPPALKQSVIGSEDQAFCSHNGFDWEDIQVALEQHGQRPGKRLRGASTISQQVARTLFLLPYRSWVRKGAEAYLTVLVEFVWPKKRILEAYLNLVDFGHGNFGAEAASQAYFNVPVSGLTRAQAYRLASILPNPDKWRATRGGKRRLGRAHARFWEAERDGLDWCVR